MTTTSHLERPAALARPLAGATGPGLIVTAARHRR
jgi:hypothetical protein